MSKVYDSVGRRMVLPSHPITTLLFPKHPLQPPPEMLIVGHIYQLLWLPMQKLHPRKSACNIQAIPVQTCDLTEIRGQTTEFDVTDEVESRPSEAEKLGSDCIMDVI